MLLNNTKLVFSEFFTDFIRFFLAISARVYPSNSLSSHFRISSSFIREVHKTFTRRFLPAFLLCLHLLPYQRHIRGKYIFFFLGNFRSFSLKKSWRQVPCNSRTGRFYPLKMGCKWRQPSTTSPPSHIYIHFQPGFWSADRESH